MAQMHKVTVEGWVIKNDEDTDISEWGIDNLISNMVDYTVKSTLLDVLQDAPAKPVVADPVLVKNDLQEVDMPIVTVEDVQIDSPSGTIINPPNETIDVSISSGEEGTFNGI